MPHRCWPEIDDTFNLDPVDVEARITSKTKAILAVHMSGRRAISMRSADIANRHNIVLIEDAAQHSVVAITVVGSAR